MNIQVRKFSFKSKYDDVTIHGVCMVPEQPVGIIQMVHGMCEHKGRFMHFLRAMAERGYIALMHDSRGHGESVRQSDDIGYCYDSKEIGFIADIYKITQQIKKAYPDLPLILYGHSMGSLAVRVFLRHHDDVIDGLIVAGCPGYNDLLPLGLWAVKQMQRNKGERYRSALSQKVVLDGFKNRFRAEGEYAWLAAKKSVAEEFRGDVLCTFTYTLNGFETLLNMMYITYRAIGYQMEQPDLPILFVSGMDDPCYLSESKWKQAMERMMELGYHDIREIRYDGLRHEIHNEEDKDIVFDDIATFCRGVVEKRH